jgi:formamidopyrimidine-DNA glycosylase
MPELPEVENIRRYLIRQRVPGRTFTRVEAGWPGAANADDRAGGIAGLTGRRVEEIGRHGKNLLLVLDIGVLALHMGMTGSLAVRGPTEPRLRFTHTLLHLDDGRRIEVEDPRKWASAALVGDAPEVTASLGPDALSPEFLPGPFTAEVRRRRSPVKALLLDQHLVAGVGNIYADEALFRAGISPLRRGSDISEARLHSLHAAIIATLNRAVSFIESHRLADDRPFVVDAYDARMALERRQGSACPKCRRTLKTAKIGGRTAYYCSICQR